MPACGHGNDGSAEALKVDREAAPLAIPGDGDGYGLSAGSDAASWDRVRVRVGVRVARLLVLAASVAAARPLRDGDVHPAAARTNGRRVGRGRPRWRRARATQAGGRGVSTGAAAAAAFQGDQERGRLVDFEQPLDRVNRATIVGLQPHAAAFGELEAPGWPKQW
eukprot:scaffold110993_cov57-Phaeocystis_antarctica.AAC.2